MLEQKMPNISLNKDDNDITNIVQEFRSKDISIYFTTIL